MHKAAARLLATTTLAFAPAIVHAQVVDDPNVQSTEIVVTARMGRNG